jgi:hypothetical protein
MASQIADGVIAAYASTAYRVSDGSHQFTLRVGERSPELFVVLRAGGFASACFITAWNPYSEETALSENRRAQRALLSDLQVLGCKCLVGVGEGNGCDWSEESILALGLGLEDARSVGGRYRQNAIVWAGSDAVPHLILLR